MGANGSNSAQCTPSLSTSRYIPYGRQPPRNTSLYDPSTSHSIDTAPVVDGYVESRETERPMLLNDRRDIRKRYHPPYHNDPPSHYHTDSLRQEDSLAPASAIDDSTGITHETYPSRYRHPMDDCSWNYDRRKRDRSKGDAFEGDSYRPTDTYHGFGTSTGSRMDWYRPSGVSNRWTTGRSLDARIHSATGPPHPKNDVAVTMDHPRSQKFMQSGDASATLDMVHTDDTQQSSAPATSTIHATTSPAFDTTLTPNVYGSSTQHIKKELNTPHSLLKHNGPVQRLPSSLMDDSKENTAPRMDSKDSWKLSQQQIVTRIDEIENDITKYEEMLKLAKKREAERLPPLEEDQLFDTKGDKADEESIPERKVLHQITDQQLSPTTRQPPQALINRIRTNNMDKTLYDRIISSNQHLAKKNSYMKSGWQGKLDGDWADSTKWTSLYARLEDYPCYKKNLLTFDKIKRSMASYLAFRDKRLQQKERRLLGEFKDIYSRWKIKNRSLDRLRHDTDLDSQTIPAIRNPERHPSKTTATIPPMILDSKERARVYDDYSGLVKDPLAYYHTGADTEDMWTRQEMTTFMTSYLRYPKKFSKVAMAIGTKTTAQCVLFYYRKKTKINFKTLMRKGKRGKNRKKDQLAAAIRRATDGVATNARPSKGSALMADIGQAKVAQGGKSREQRALEADNAYWEGVAERRKAKRPISGASTGDDGSDLKRRVGRRNKSLSSSPALPDTGIPSTQDTLTMDMELSCTGTNETHSTASSPPSISHTEPKWKQGRQRTRRTKHIDSTGIVSMDHSPSNINPPPGSPYPNGIRHHPILDPLGRDILNPSPTTIRVSDLLNADDESTDPNSWQSWFGP